MSRLRAGTTAVLIIVIISAIILAASAFYLLKKPTSPTASNPVIQTQPTPTPASSDETANWKTYNYSPPSQLPLKSFSFKYPDSLKVTNVDQINTSFTSGLPAVVIAEKQLTDLNIVLKLNSCIRIYSTTGYENSASALEQIAGGTFDLGKLPKVTSTEQIKINNIDSIQRQVKQYGDQDETIEAAVVKDGVTLYVRSCSQKDNNVLDQILSTFKFTE